MVTPVDLRKLNGIVGTCFMRNVNANLLERVLTNNAKYCDLGIITLDDASTDDTYERCRAHPAVVKAIRNTKWDSERLMLQTNARQLLLNTARVVHPLWIMYFDCDEVIEFDMESFRQLSRNTEAISMKLFDFYLTPDDCQDFRHDRKWCGIEYRNNIIFFRNTPDARFHYPWQRNVTIGKPKCVESYGYVKHYGKAVSVEDWERKCDYYSTYFPEPFVTRWTNRKGKAIKHDMKSDFGTPLIKWEERIDKGIPLKEYH